MSPGGGFPMYTVDAFSRTPFSGNPAAICPLENDQDIPDDLKQKLGNEMNLSETVFVSKLDKNDTFEKGKKFLIRWFTPTQEVEICGHATLATAAVIFSCYGNQNETLTFQTMKIGDVYASRKGDKVVVDFPNMEPKPASTKYQKVVEIAACGYPVVDIQISPTKKILARLDDSVTRTEYEKISPDFRAMHNSLDEWILGVILTLKGTGEYDFYTRFFAPWVGVDEDPVCGSAHAVLAPYWAKILGKKEMKVRQCSKRGGDVFLKVRDDGRIEISGHFKVVLKGNVFVS